MKEYFFSFYTAEVQPILLKDSANRMQCKMKEYFFHCYPVKHKYANRLKHQTLPLMGATRLAS
ncbi:hypothetical protein, partial [Prevotellamassilia timonensis]|uniref:hypothetical protein n=1 Tax=Prevotellamassilia timonensis TaxID=1852370 RepID=UPI00307AC5D2